MKNLEERIDSNSEIPDKTRDPVGYYKRFYKGATRWKLKILDSGLYNILWKEELLQYVPLCRVQKPRKNYGKDLLQYYKDKYAGVTRTKLRDIDSALHQRLRRAKLLKDIPSAYRSFNGDPLGYYEKNYQGITQRELRKIDPSLYQVLWRKKALDNVPKQ